MYNHYLQCSDTVLNRTKHKTYVCTLMVEPCSMSQHYITKQLEYIAKDHIAMHTILFKLKQTLFFSVLMV